MFDAPEELQVDQALRNGLRALPVPEPSPDFDARILAALRAPTPWWRRWWEPARPLLLGASCSLAVTLLALHWSLSTPVTASRPAVPGESERALATAPTRTPSLDALLDRPNLSAGSLSAWAARPPAMPSPDRRPAPKPRAQLLRKNVLFV